MGKGKGTGKRNSKGKIVQKIKRKEIGLASNISQAGIGIHFMSANVLIRLQYRHLVPALVNRTSANDRMYREPWITCPKRK